MTMRRFGYVWMSAALVAAGVTGCATKKYVRNQTAPIIQHAGQLNNETAENTRKIHDVDQRAQEGIQKAQSSADSANQNAQNATQQASNAQNSANEAVNRADSLDSVVKDLDNYKQVSNVSVNFAFNKAVLTAKDRSELDSFASQLASSNNYILEVTGGTDSTGPAQYNYDLSQRRADSVVQYLAAKYNIPARKFYLIGIGKDQYVASNKTAAGRAQNRRVQVQLLQNVGMQAAAQGGQGGQPNQTAQPNTQQDQNSQPSGQSNPPASSNGPQSQNAQPGQSAQSSSVPEE
ncbi:MAG TPA: OmpA family protein [Terracidiphilus sp.]|nr:OmpA family protein [Terracidiphilus sp.]